jgi:Peptidase of plants and bacteria
MVSQSRIGSDQDMPQRLRTAIAAPLAALALLAAGCAANPRALPVRLDPGALEVPVRVGPLTDYPAAVRAIAAVMARDLGLPLPSAVTLFIYPSREAYALGLTDVGGLSAARAREISGYSAGLGQHRRLFINEAALGTRAQRMWLGVLAHELTHVVQYQLAGGRRGQSEQWLREGMADWVASQVLERLGIATFRSQREDALRAVAGELPRLHGDPLDLVALGQPRGWETRHLRSGDRLTYRLAFLLTDDLIRRRGFDRLVDYFRAFARSDDRFGHFQQAFGLSVGEFEASALQHVRDEAAGGTLGVAP